MRFFDSEIVREELSEINRLQTSIYGKMFGFGFLSPTDRKEHVEKLETLLGNKKRCGLGYLYQMTQKQKT